MTTVVASCIAALGAGYILRWVLEESGVDVEAHIRRLFGQC